MRLERPLADSVQAWARMASKMVQAAPVSANVGPPGASHETNCLPDLWFLAEGFFVLVSNRV